MKKFVAILLVAFMLVSLAACGGNTDKDEASPPASSPDSSPASSPNGTSAEKPSGGGKVGWYPDALEASKNRDTYTVAYISIAMTDQLHSSVNIALKEWSEKLNCDYVSFDAKADYDAFMSGVETYANQGIDGLIIDVDVSAQTRTREICEENDIVWFPAMSPFMDEAQTTYVAPAAVLSSYKCGQDQVEWMYASYEQELGVAAVDASQIGYIFLDWSPHPEIHLREEGSRARYAELYPDLVDSNWMTIDVLPGGPDNFEGAFDLVSAYLSTNGSKFDYWFISSSTDEFAIGAARAVEQLGMESVCLISAIMGGSVIEDWDTGYTGSWRSLVTVPLVVLTEPMICGMLAILDGRATYETLWQDSVPAGQSYGIIEFPPEIFTMSNKDTYWNSVDAWIAHAYP